MKNKMLIKYKSIFKYEDHKETMNYQEIGEYESNQTGKRITFTAQNTKIDIQIKGNHVWLTNNQSTLVLALHQKIENTYQTMYGNIQLFTYLETLEVNKNIKLKYSLWDGNTQLHKVYVIIQVQSLEN